MLAISPNASDAITRALEGASIPKGVGLRLAPGGRSPEGTAVEITFVTVADPADQVIDTGAPADIFVAPAVAPLVDDQLLDADVGRDGSITFALRHQGSSNERQG